MSKFVESVDTEIQTLDNIVACNRLHERGKLIVPEKDTRQQFSGCSQRIIKQIQLEFFKT